jgi:tetratricopeptide (TPR) repeat protein
MGKIEELVQKGQSLMNDGQFDDALGFFEQALLLNQNDPDLWNNKGVALRSLGRYEESMECFNKSLEIEPRDKFASIAVMYLK